MSEMEIKKKDGRGGARAGAGRKLGSGQGLVKKLQICVTDEQKAAFEKNGGGKWLRSLLDGAEVYKPAEEPLKPAAKNKGAKDSIDFNAMLMPEPDNQTLAVCPTDKYADEGICKGDTLVVDTRLEPQKGDYAFLESMGETKFVRYKPKQHKDMRVISVVVSLARTVKR